MEGLSQHMWQAVLHSMANRIESVEEKRKTEKEGMLKNLNGSGHSVD